MLIRRDSMVAERLRRAQEVRHSRSSVALRTEGAETGIVSIQRKAIMQRNCDGTGRDLLTQVMGSAKPPEGWVAKTWLQIP